MSPGPQPARARLGRGSLAASAIALVSLALAVMPASGCSGSEAQDVLAKRAAPASTIPGSSGTSGTSGGTSGTSGGTSGTSGTIDASIDGATECPEEQEPNNGRDDANVLAASRCGAIQPNSDNEFLTFQLKSTTTSMQITFEGKVALRVDVNNESVLLGLGGSPKVPFVKGATYYIEIKATIRDNRVPWRVNLIEQ
jgi:hypothetical protein